MAEQHQAGGVTLWDLLTVISFVLPVAGASGAARVTNAGIVGYLLVVSAGLAIGVSCAVCMRIALVRVGGYLVRSKIAPRSETWYSGLMLTAAFIWMVFALVAGIWVATKIVSLLR
jgi:hypothetical protein